MPRVSAPDGEKLKTFRILLFFMRRQRYEASAMRINGLASYTRVAMHRLLQVIPQVVLFELIGSRLPGVSFGAGNTEDEQEEGGRGDLLVSFRR